MKPRMPSQMQTQGQQDDRELQEDYFDSPEFLEKIEGEKEHQGMSWWNFDGFNPVEMKGESFV